MANKTAVLGVLCLWLGQGLAYAQAPVPKPGAEHKKLEAFVGTWTYEGEARQSVFGPAGRVTGTDVWEALPGGFFVQHHWDEKNPLGNVKGLEVWGYDSVKKHYTYNYFSSVGEMGSGVVTVDGGAWKGAGTAISYDGKPAHGRCAMTFSGATSFTMKCDASADGKAWAPSFDAKFTRK